MKTLISCLAAFLICLVTSEYAAAQFTIDFERLPNGTVILNNTVLTNEFLFSDGVTFPDGLIAMRCVSDPNPFNDCDQARSGQNVVISKSDPVDEFSRMPIAIEFNGTQRFVSLYVNGFDQTGQPHTATLRAYTIAGVEIASQTANFNSSTSWPTQLRVDDSQGRIKRVILTGREIGQLSVNWLLVDDLTFERKTPPIVDPTPPTASIVSPLNGATVTGPDVNITVSASDNFRLQSVDMQLRHVPTGNLIRDFTGGNVCGFGSCPETFIERTFSFSLTLEGEYRVTLRARDAAGNSAETSSNFIVDLQPLPPKVFVSKIEFNQAVQSRLHPAEVFGTEAHNPIPIIPNKDLVIRYYLFAIGAPRPDFSARLIINITKEDGSFINKTISPNAGIPRITADQDPVDEAERDTTRIAQRADLNRTLNFVIPGDHLNDATFMKLRLLDGIDELSEVQVNGISSEAAYLGLNIIRVFAPSRVGPPVTDAEIENSILAYLRRAYPVSEVIVHTIRSYRYRPRVVRVRDDCRRLRWRIWRAFGGDDAPVRIRRPNLRTTTLAVARQLRDCAGKAKIGKGVAITTLFGDIAAHEIGHALGLIHASNDHEESRGGESKWEPWPYPHGRIGPSWTNFGTIVQQLSPPSPADAGQWQIILIDPCPTSDLSQRLPDCMVPDDQTPHELMSYGISNTNLGSFVNLKGQWTSDVTYTRIYNAIRFGSFAAPSPTPLSVSDQSEQSVDVSAAERVEAFLIDGEILGNGTIELEPILQKPLPRVIVEGTAPGPYTLELLEGNGRSLLSQSFDLEPTGEVERPISLVVPYVQGAKSLLIKDASGILLDQKFSANAPQVRVLSPNGGEVLQSGSHIIRWQGSDADGDTLSYLVQYSPDNGVRWQGIGLVEDGDSTALEFEVGELIPGTLGIIRITASDGFNTIVDQSDGVFTLGTASGKSAVAARVGCSLALAESCQVSIPLSIDVAGTFPTELLGSFSGKFNWNPKKLKFIRHSGLVAGFLGFVNAANAAKGEIIFNGTNVDGAGGEVEFLKADFQVVGAVTDTGSINMAFSAMSAAKTFNNLLPLLAVENCHYTIRASGLLGDVNGDGLVNSTDANIVLAFNIGFALEPPDLARIFAEVGDVNRDKITNSTDALLILSFARGIATPYPIGKGVCQ